MRLVWDQPGDRVYETGVNRGVLYHTDGSGVPWNGLISVQVDTDVALTSVYFDGRKVNELADPGDFSGTLTAFTYPDEFLPYIGVEEYENRGLFIYDQPQPRFGLSYRTLVGNDVDGIGAGYKLHILYNLQAVQSTINYQTIGSETDPIPFSWRLTGIPEPAQGLRPTVHVAFDSREMDPYLLADVEDILYGDDTRDPTLPSLQELTSFIDKWERLLVLDNGDGTFTVVEAEGVDGVYISMLSADEFQIVSETAVFTDGPTNETYELSSTAVNDEDI